MVIGRVEIRIVQKIQQYQPTTTRALRSLKSLSLFSLQLFSHQVVDPTREKMRMKIAKMESVVFSVEKSTKSSFAWRPPQRCTALAVLLRAPISSTTEQDHPESCFNSHTCTRPNANLLDHSSAYATVKKAPPPMASEKTRDLRK